MPYCPNCGTEYRRGFSLCSDCEVQLVEGTAPEDDPGTPYQPPRPSRLDEYEELEPVCVAKLPSEMEAEIVLSILRSYEVRAFVAGTGLSQWSEAGHLGQMTRVVGPLNDFRVMVHPDDEEKAREVVADNVAGNTLEDESVPVAAGHYAGDDGMGRDDDGPWRLDPDRNKRVIRIVALFFLIPFVLAALSQVLGLLELAG